MMTTTLKPLPMAELPLPLEDGVPPPHLAAPLAVRAERLASLDIFRGITIATMLLVNNPGSWGDIYGPLRHAEWHGWTMTDLVFPFFLFIVGVAIPFSMAKRSATGALTRGQMLVGIWTRALSLVLLGLLLAAIPRDAAALPEGYTVLRVLRVVAQVFVWVAFVALLFPWKWRRVSVFMPLGVALAFVILYWAILLANRQGLNAGLPENFKFGGGILTPWRMRFPGVLQRIGVCYGVAATIALFFGWRMILTSAVILMAIYAALMLKAPSYNGHVPGSLEKDSNLQRKVDEKVFGDSKTGGRNHNYSYPDPEGLLSTLPAIGSVLLGILVGMRLRSDQTPTEKGASVLAWGVAVTCIGVLLSWWLMPINKQLWTPSFTVFTVGLGMLGLGAVYYVADIRGRRAWALPFRIYGMNAILAFVLAGVIRQITFWNFKHPQTGETVAPVAYARGEVADGLHHAAAWLVQHANVPPGLLDSASNVSLAQAIAFVLIILIPLTILYFCRVFIKV
jgi:predicted acyltransferase